MSKWLLSVCVVAVSLCLTPTPARPSGVSSFGAVVSPEGRLVFGDASSVQKNLDLEGTYYVYFPYDVRRCVFTASVIGTGSTPVGAPAVITVANAMHAPQAVAVQIRSVSGMLVRRGFELILRCF